MYFFQSFEDTYFIVQTLLQKGGWSFSKMAVLRGMGNRNVEILGKPGMGWGVYNGGMGNFLSLFT